MGPMGQEQLELFTLELGKIAAFDFVYSLASTNINQSAPNLVTVFMIIRSRMSLIMGQVIPDQSVLSAFEIEKLNLTLSQTSPCFYVSAVQGFRKHCGKGRNCL